MMARASGGRAEPVALPAGTVEAAVEGGPCLGSFRPSSAWDET